MARVKFIRDEEPNIRSLETSGGVVDGALYVATDTGTMWMGTGTSTLLQIKDNIDTNTWNALKGATSSAGGAAGYAPAPAKGAQNSFLRGDATWQTITKSTIGLGNVDNTADANKSVKYATSAGSANTASVANSVAWDNVTGAPIIPNVSDYVKHEAINEYTAPDNKLNVELISGLDKYIEQKAPSPSIATTSKAGIVKPDGTTITVAADGTISGASTYTLPTASASSLGGVKVGNGLSVTDDGTLSAASTEEWSIVEVSIDATSITQEQYNTIATSWPNVIFKFDYKSGYSNEEVYLPSKRSLNTDFIFFRVDYTQKLDLKIPQVTAIIIHKNLSISSKITTNLSVATSRNNYGIMQADATTLECDDNGKISVKDGGITSTKLADGVVTKAKLGSDVSITYSSTAEPTASDGKNGDVWIVYEA